MKYGYKFLRFCFGFIFFSLINCAGFGMPAENSPQLSVLQNGYWRGEILRNDGHPIVFCFEIRDSMGKKIMYIDNGKERFLVDQISQKGDSVFIEMPFFDSRFSLRLENNRFLSGYWKRNHGSLESVIPFRAIYNERDKFITKKAALFDISGRWTVMFRGKKDSTVAVGEFRQYGNNIQGTFLTTTGDYRYLSGAVDGDSLKLSTFDGGHAYSFVALIKNNTQISKGFFYSGASALETWTAYKNENAKLPDEFNQTKLKDTQNATLNFRFPDLNGKLVSLQDPKFKNKVVVLQILGSWCPNCMDETRFLSPFYDANKSRGLEIIALAYERTASYSEAKKLVQHFVNRLKVNYPVLITGVTMNDSLKAQKTIPEIQKLIGFPTTIFIDKKGRVRKIHTGFTGPGTGEHYTAFINEFNEIVNELLGE